MVKGVNGWIGAMPDRNVQQLPAYSADGWS